MEGKGHQHDTNVQMCKDLGCFSHLPGASESWLGIFGNHNDENHSFLGEHYAVKSKVQQNFCCKAAEEVLSGWKSWKAATEADSCQKYSPSAWALPSTQEHETLVGPCHTQGQAGFSLTAPILLKRRGAGPTPGFGAEGHSRACIHMAGVGP